jgi:hypothetical protein
MPDRWSQYLTFLLILILTAIGFVVWVMFLILVWAVLHLVGVNTSLWLMIEALSTAVAAAAVVGAGFVAYKEINESASSRHVEIADKLFQELNSAENIAARRHVFQHLPAFVAGEQAVLSVQDHDAMKMVLNSLDRVAFLTQENWIPEATMMPWMNPMVVKAWMRLKPFVEAERERRREPDYYERAGALGEHCLAWRARHKPGAEIVWLDDAL